jgi:hypothetical protein
MERFEDVTRRLTEGLDLSKRARRRIAGEARAHLEDEMQRCVAEGMGEDEAQREAEKRFGEADSLKALIDAALARHQARRRRVRAALLMVGGLALLVAVLVVGAAFQALDDGVSGDHDLPSVPLWAKMTLYLSVFGVSLLLLTIAAAALFRRRVVHCIIAGVLVCATTILSEIVFAHTPLRWTIGWIYPGESAVTLAGKSFFHRLYLCWAAALPLGAVCIVLRRDRRAAVWFLRALAVGALSASLWGIQRAGGYARWLLPYKWPKLTSAALFALFFVLLVAMLARTMAPRRAEAPSRAPEEAAEPEPSPTPSPS